MKHKRTVLERILPISEDYRLLKIENNQMILIKVKEKGD